MHQCIAIQWRSPPSFSTEKRAAIANFTNYLSTFCDFLWLPLHWKFFRKELAILRWISLSSYCIACRPNISCTIISVHSTSSASNWVTRKSKEDPADRIDDLGHIATSTIKLADDCLEIGSDLRIVQFNVEDYRQLNILLATRWLGNVAKTRYAR